MFGRLSDKDMGTGGSMPSTPTPASGSGGLKSNYPIVSGMTPTAGGVVFFGDVGGNFYALNAATGQKLWGQHLGGAIGGGVITYTADGEQKVAVAAGFTIAAVADEDRDTPRSSSSASTAPRQRNEELHSSARTTRAQVDGRPKMEVCMELDPVILSRIQFALRHQLPHHLPGLHHRAWRRGWRRSRACGSSPATRSTGASSTSGSRSSRCRSAWAW